jgi:hypothetical protein
MSIRSEVWPAGVPCWADIQVPDVPAAQAFYSAVLGWTYTEPAADFGGYVIGQIGDAATAGIGPMMGGAPTAWTLYLATDDADKTATAVTENGGSVLLPVGDVGTAGRLAIVADPTGAVFGLWQAGDMIGSALYNAPGGITWEDLRTADADSARTFYGAVFGFDYAPIEGAPEDYTTFSLAGEGQPRGGIGGMMGPAETPPHWLVYFGVADTDAAVAAAAGAGGHILAPAFDTPFGRMAGLADPFGGMFWIASTTGDA